MKKVAWLRRSTIGEVEAVLCTVVHDCVYCLSFVIACYHHGTQIVHNLVTGDDSLTADYVERTRGSRFRNGIRKPESSFAYALSNPPR